MEIELKRMVNNFEFEGWVYNDICGLYFVLKFFLFFDLCLVFKINKI